MLEVCACIEFGFLLVYRSGWTLGIAAVVVNVAASLILLPVAIFFFRDKISWVNVLGIFLVLAEFVVSEICYGKRFTQSRKGAKKVENLAFLATRVPARVLRGKTSKTTKNSRIRDFRLPGRAGDVELETVELNFV